MTDISIYGNRHTSTWDWKFQFEPCNHELDIHLSEMPDVSPNEWRGVPRYQIKPDKALKGPGKAIEALFEMLDVPINDGKIDWQQARKLGYRAWKACHHKARLKNVNLVEIHIQNMVYLTVSVNGREVYSVHQHDPEAATRFIGNILAIAESRGHPNVW